MKSSFDPVFDRKTRVMILGSLPGDVSLARGEYYGNPRNQFWRLVGQIIAVDLVRRTYDDRLVILKAHGIGLWDVVRNADRPGSLDARIRNPTANTLAEFAATLPELQALAFNGGKAFALGRKRFSSGAGPRLLPLPSSSPAHTASFEAKAAAWGALSAWLAKAG